jgi:hypothetical protein
MAIVNISCKCQYYSMAMCLSMFVPINDICESHILLLAYYFNV